MAADSLSHFIQFSSFTLTDHPAGLFAIINTSAPANLLLSHPLCYLTCNETGDNFFSLYGQFAFQALFFILSLQSLNLRFLSHT